MTAPMFWARERHQSGGYYYYSSHYRIARAPGGWNLLSAGGASLSWAPTLREAKAAAERHRGQRVEAGE